MTEHAMSNIVLGFLAVILAAVFSIAWQLRRHRGSPPAVARRLTASEDQATDAQANATIQLLLTKSSIRTVVAITIALAVMLGLQTYFSQQHTPDPTLMNMLSLVVGVILGCYGQAFNFAFGSSPQSKTKDQTIAALTKSLPLAAQNTDDTPLKVDLVGTPGNPPPEEPKP